MMSSLSTVLESLLPLFRGGATSRLTAATPPPSPSPSDSLDHDEDSNSGDSSSHGGSSGSQAVVGLGVLTSDICGVRRMNPTINQKTGVGTSK